jgi:hypothetical protein
MDRAQVEGDRPPSGLAAAGWSWAASAAAVATSPKPIRKPKEGKLRPGLY